MIAVLDTSAAVEVVLKRESMQKTFYFFLLFLLFMGGCTEESRNKIFKQADNLLGKDLRVSYVADSGTIVKSGYVQVPIVRTIVEEIK